MGRAEGYVENYLASQAKRLGFECFKFSAPSNAGVPDRIVIGNGFTVFVELKAKGCKPRPLQVSVIRSMRKAGADVFVLDCREDVDALLSFMRDNPFTISRFDGLPSLGVA